MNTEIKDSQKERFYNIDFLRVILILGIVMHHAFMNKDWSFYVMFPDINLYSIFKKMFLYANNGVEGFFIISGFFFILTFKSTIPFIIYIFKKYIRLAPVILFATILCALSGIWGIMNFDILNNIINVLLLNNFFFRWCNGAVGSVWYVSALFSCFILFYALKKYIKNPSLYYGIVSVLFFSGYLLLEILKHGSFAGPGTNIGIFNIGFLRAISGFSLGICIAELYKTFVNDNVKNYNLSSKYYFLISIIELLSLIFIIWWTYFIHGFINNIIYVLVFTVLFVLFILKKGCISNMLNKDIWTNLGKYVYSIFVCHTLIYKIFSYKFWAMHEVFVYNHYWIPVLINFVLVIVLGIFAYHFVEQPMVKIFNKKNQTNKDTKLTVSTTK